MTPQVTTTTSDAARSSSVSRFAAAAARFLRFRTRRSVSSPRATRRSTATRQRFTTRVRSWGFLAAGGRGGGACLGERATPTPSPPPPSPPRAAWSPFNDNLLATGSDDTTVKLWTVPDGGLTENMKEATTTLHGHGKPVSLLAWNPVASNVIASVGKDPCVKIWDVERGAAGSTLDGFGALIQVGGGGGGVIPFIASIIAPPPPILQRRTSRGTTTAASSRRPPRTRRRSCTTRARRPSHRSGRRTRARRPSRSSSLASATSS